MLIVPTLRRDQIRNSTRTVYTVRAVSSSSSAASIEIASGNRGVKLHL